MADNPKPTKTGSLPPLPSSGMTGKLPSPTTQLPVKKGGPGKIVVMLSSVAKPPPAVTQPMKIAPVTLRPPPAVTQPTRLAPEPAAPPGARPPPIVTQPVVLRPPSKEVASTEAFILPTPAQPATIPEVKLPPKTLMPQVGVLRPAAPVTPIPPSPDKDVPTPKPLLPPVGKRTAQHIPPIKLNEPAPDDETRDDSILLAPSTASPTPGPSALSAASIPAQAVAPAAVVPTPAAVPSSLPSAGSSASRSTGTLPLPMPPPSALKNRPPDKTADKPTDKPTPLIAPALARPQRPEIGSSALPVPGPVEPPIGAAPAAKPPVLQGSLPPPLPPPSVKAAANSVQVVPPMIEREPEPVAEKLAQPNFSHETTTAKSDTSSPAAPEASAVPKAPALVQPDLPAAAPSAEPVTKNPPPKPAAPPASSMARSLANPLKQSTPLVLSSTSKIKMSDIAEAKPALRPATLPKRATQIIPEPKVEPPPLIIEAKSAAPEAATPTPTPEAKSPSPANPPPIGPDVKVVKLDQPETKVASAAAGVEKVVAKKSKEKPKEGHAPPPLPQKKVPLTRAERAAVRGRRSTIAFYILFAGAMVALYFISLRYARDTRVEGQIIPPPGMPLNNEVWVVTDFRPLAAGVADDLAKDRAPVLRDIQERQDHVQRTQADIAAREEKIRFIQGEISAAQQEIEEVIKQSRDATQQIWDVDGAEIDTEYEARLDELDKTISDRAKSLKLNYQPDPNFRSPEVWANAYRLALYQVPPGVDSVKEHAWLADQMKTWRDLEKSLDDRKEQLREKAAQLKLAPAPKIADLNAKIDDLQQRADSTEAEEVPLKAELQQAQIDLASSQSTLAGLDDKYYKQLYSLPQEVISDHITLASNGRFTWIDNDRFAEGETERHYWIFACATRPDGRQYWALYPITVGLYRTVEMIVEPTGFISTKALLRPDLSPEEQAE